MITLYMVIIMMKFDEEYVKLLKKILNEGIEVKNRTGINTIKIPTYNFEFDLSEEFPILQTKQTFYRQAIIEMLWIWQMGSNNVNDLHERNVHIWDEWKIDEDGIYRIYEPITDKYDKDKEVIVMDPLSVPISDPFGYQNEMKPKYNEVGNVMTAKSLIEGKNIKAAKYYGKEFANTIGTAYGFNVDRYQMTKNMEYILKNKIMDRRIVNNLFQNEFLRTSVLPPCVYCNEWDVTDGKLNLLVHQRSCDVPLGLPFNITQYAAFLLMMSQVTNLKPGKISYSIKDAHIYVNQIEGVKEQIRRYDRYKEMSLWDKDKLLIRKEILNNFLDNNYGELPDADRYIINTDLKIIDLIENPTTPELWLNPNITSFFDFDNSKDLKDVKVKKYKHMGKLKFPITQ